MIHTRKRTNKPTKRLNKAVKSNVFYVVDIIRWSWGASFGLLEVPVNSGKSYHDLRHLKLCGRFIQPPQLSGVEANFTLVPDERLNRENENKAQLSSIGRLNLREEASALVSIPADILPCFLTMLCANQFKYVVLSGAPPRNRQANLYFLSFEMQIDNEDFKEPS
jgi:hypothetical protein